MSSPAHVSFDRRYRAFLFDMDGTLVSSIAAAERIWSQWARRHGLDVAAFLPTIHGVRAIDTVTRLALPGVDPLAEANWITAAEIADLDGTVEIAGAIRFLNALPPTMWAVVTSTPRALAVQRLKAAGIPTPPVLITSEHVAVGKPDPACYLLAARTLGVDAADCLVFEDAEVGILAGAQAGATVMVVRATHGAPMATPHAAIDHYEALSASLDESGWLRLAQRS
ncbi:sugar-phosphatase [Actimicrobium sp. GrIS 1.19]|uniref:HAD-IA family hydrolase n=1 Tax=Actimicrobium sp. GrIS 1.19 TaxID=3071708 RepID=UPI002DFE2679|nr:sugar-phosphatase [Actimicrobium sp. GrIS 1.19]